MYNIDDDGVFSSEKKMKPKSAILVKCLLRSLVFILEHVMSDNVGFKKFPFPAKA